MIEPPRGVQFDGSGRGLYPGELRVDGEHIVAVAEGAQRVPRDGAQLLDGRGMTLIPGLVEAHAHLSWPSSVECVRNTMRLPAEEHLLVTAQNARITLDHGYTIAYSAGALGGRFEVVLRHMIRPGFLPGPRLRASSLERGAEGVMGIPAPTHDRSVAGLQAYVRRVVAMGADSIKFLLSSDEGFAPGSAQQLMYSEAEVQAFAAAARESGIWLNAHAQTTEAVKRAVRGGFRRIFHCTCADEEALDLLEAHKAQLFVAPAPGLAGWPTCCWRTVTR